jgi:hypothetical protein
MEVTEEEARAEFDSMMAGIDDATLLVAAAELIGRLPVAWPFTIGEIMQRFFWPALNGLDLDPSTRNEFAARIFEEILEARVTPCNKVEPNAAGERVVH